MGNVANILSATQVTHEITVEVGGEQITVPFVCRKLTSDIALKIAGSGVFDFASMARMHREGSLTEDKVNKEAAKMPADKQAKLVRAYIEACCVSPKIADVSNSERDEIAYEDLGVFISPLFAAIIRSGGVSPDFRSTPSSE